MYVSSSYCQTMTSGSAPQSVPSFHASGNPLFVGGAPPPPAAPPSAPLPDDDDVAPPLAPAPSELAALPAAPSSPPGPPASSEHPAIASARTTSARADRTTCAMIPLSLLRPLQKHPHEGRLSAMGSKKSRMTRLRSGA